MILSILVIIFCLFLDGISSNYFLFLSNFTQIAILLSFPFFKNNKRLYYIISFIISYCYDLLYTNIPFLSFVLLMIIFRFTTVKKEIELGTIIISYFLYHFLFVSILVLIGYQKNIYFLLGHIISSFFYNLLFGGLLFFLIRLKYPKKKINY